MATLVNVPLKQTPFPGLRNVDGIIAEHQFVRQGCCNQWPLVLTGYDGGTGVKRNLFKENKYEQMDKRPSEYLWKVKDFQIFNAKIFFRLRGEFNIN